MATEEPTKADLTAVFTKLRANQSNKVWIEILFITNNDFN
jgi:hypothetical protein